MSKKIIFTAFFLSMTLAVNAAPILWIDDADGVIGKLDVASGTVSVVGNAGVTLTDIAFDASGNLWGVSPTNLYRIDQATGAATLVGALGAAGTVNALGFGPDGTLYGASDQLYRINTATGKATAVGAGSLGFRSLGDLALAGGTLFGTSTSNQLESIDSSTGAGSLVGTFGVNEMYGLAGTSAGTLYGVAGTSLYTLNKSTGAASFLFSFVGQGLGSAFGAAIVEDGFDIPRAGDGGGGSSSPVPEPGSLWTMGLGSASLLATRVRRKQRA